MASKETIKYKPIYKHLTIEEGKAFFEKKQRQIRNRCLYGLYELLQYKNDELSRCR